MKTTHKILINAVELASLLAESEMVKHYSDDVAIYKDGDDDCLVYTDEAQELFDSFYDNYYSIIEKAKVY
jgi:hypothetical protein